MHRNDSCDFVFQVSDIATLGDAESEVRVRLGSEQYSIRHTRRSVSFESKSKRVRSIPNMLHALQVETGSPMEEEEREQREEEVN